MSEIPSWRELWFRAVGVGYMEYRQLRRWWRRRRVARRSREPNKSIDELKAAVDALKFQPGRPIPVSPRDMTLFVHSGAFTNGPGTFFIKHSNNTVVRGNAETPLEIEYLRRMGRLDPSDD